MTALLPPEPVAPGIDGAVLLLELVEDNANELLVPLPIVLPDDDEVFPADDTVDESELDPLIQ